MTGALPRLEGVLELYAAAVDRYGTDRFTAAQARRELPVDASSRLLELAVAYGLLEFDGDGDAYAVRIEPDAPIEEWRSSAIERAERLRTAAIDRTDGNGRAEDGVETLTRGSRRFASVAVGDDPSLEPVVERLAALPLEEFAGVVLRSPGEGASAVQRLADRLCEPSITDETGLEGRFRKEATDVVGADKNDLEFRLFLERT
ncbi:hypothetical protein [Natronococcus jeotgali]|uniref:Uncharacterized protein n=1 Tax=Natronococcus jeotgali DSM 18795 TaxID=1227498 RepID=L9XRA3_9EURY|nr:hypothetical protein [Natronococcus jeotgali]ELY64037.1 hypothetical protein C492_05937 [Natronococcus jeotgali DSM 18795]